MIRLSLLSVAAAVLLFPSCMKWDYGEEVEFDASGPGLFIVNEGNFQYGNATLTFYNPAGNDVENEVFFRANGMRLGDVAQSMTIYDGKGWIVVNNSHVIFAINPVTFTEVGRIENLTSPRYMHFISDEKAYVSQIWDNRIFIINPRKYEIIGTITVPGMSLQSGSTEQMVQYGRYVYCSCWSYQNSIIKIDTETDEVVERLEVGIQPRSLVLDCDGKLWTITDGGYENSPYGYETPALWCIDAESFTIERRLSFKPGDTPRELCLDGDGTTLYWINDDVWRMPVSSELLPSEPFIRYHETKFYGLTVDPSNSEVYVADAIDYMQTGIVYRYAADGSIIDKFYVGVTPAAFCWKN